MSDKSLAAAQYILEQVRQSGDPAVTPMQLLKLVYIAHGYMLGNQGRPLLDEPVQAWRHGPVIPSVYRALKSFRSQPVSAVPGASSSALMLSDLERQVLDYVAHAYGKSDGITLSSATHMPGTPWSLTWERAGQNATISNDLIESFYRHEVLSQPSHSAL